MTALTAGDRFAWYRLERLLGRGGMGSVFEAVHVETGARVALKIMHRDAEEAGDTGRGATSASDVLRRRFAREARAAMTLVHPSIVRIHEYVVEGDAHALAMELLPGRALEHHLAEAGRLSITETAATLLPIVSALGLAHAHGIVHRDVKPENIFLTPAGPKLVDFGIVKLTRAEELAATTLALTRTGAILGTPYYMSPEQACGERGIDQRADVWSFGIVLYRCLTGVLPTSGASFGRIFKKIVSDPFPPLAPELGVPADVAALLDKTLQKSREDRLFDLVEAYEVLSRHTTETPLAPPFGPSTVAIGASSEDRQSLPPVDDTLPDARHPASDPADATVVIRPKR